MLHRLASPELPLSGPPAYRSGPFSLLGHSFCFHLPDEASAAYLDRTLRSFATDGGLPAVCWVVTDGGGGEPERFTAYRDGRRVFTCTDAAQVVPMMLWWVNRTVCFETVDRLMVHASVATADGRAVVLPAPQESGKTTLVAALVADGLGYLTDEAAALDPVSGMVHAYPKWLSVKPGSWALFPDLRPDLPPALAPFASDQWHVDPDKLRPGAVVASAEIAWIVVPSYRPGESSSLEPLARAEALTILVDEAFNLGRFGAAGFRTLAAVVERSQCWRLTTGDLAGAVDALRAVTG